MTRPDLNHLPLLADIQARQFSARGEFKGTAGLTSFVSTEQMQAQAAPAGVWEAVFSHGPR